MSGDPFSTDLNLSESEVDKLIRENNALRDDLERVRAERDGLTGRNQFLSTEIVRLDVLQGVAQARLDRAVKALREAQGVTDGVIWLDNNIHNYGSDGWREFFKATLRDARRLRPFLLVEIEEGK